MTVKERPDLDFLDLSQLQGKDPPPRSWVIDQWLPRGTVTILVGSGGVGKSLLAQQIATSVSGGVDWLGKVAKRGAVLGLFCEDDHDEVWRRQVAICESMDVGFDRIDRYLRIEGRAGRFNNLAYFPEKGYLEDSALLVSIREKLEEIELDQGLQLLILDNVAQMFSGGDHGENDRFKVTTFINRLTSIALEFNMAVLLLAHPGKAEGSEYSGSTAWDAAVRSRLLLRRENEDPNSRVILSRKKSNYAARGGDVPLVWQNGAFVRADGKKTLADILANASRATAVQDQVIAALCWLAERNLTASHKRQASNYLPREMRTRGQDGGYSSAEITEAMNALIADKRIEVEAELGRDRHRNPVRGLKVATDTQEGRV